MIYLKCLLHFLIVYSTFATTKGEILVDSGDPRVLTKIGQIQGYFSTTLNKKTFIAFEGIPYGRANRYEEAQPVTWSGTWIANTQYKCIQYYHYTEPGQDFVIGDEDCLYLNVYVPSVQIKNNPFDVIIFVHGGAFMFNNGGTYGPKILLDNNVIYVSMNYRLGPLGFLSTEDNAMPSNLGLRDQILALKWIKEHISSFGGNEEAITLAGMSAGGGSVHIHTLSPLTRNENLFQKALIQSGSSINAWVLVEQSQKKAQKLAGILGCPTKNSEDIVKCLKSRSARQIVAGVKHFQPWLYNPFSPFAVTIDSWSRNPVLPEHPYLTLQKGDVKNVPVIFSNTQAEGLYPGADFIGDPNNLNIIDKHWNELLPFILDFNNTVKFEDRDKISQLIRKEYFKNNEVNERTYKDLIRMISDRLFIYDIEKAAKLHAGASQSNVYYYVYSYRAAHSKSEYRSKSNKNFGTSHGDDTICVLSSNVDCQSTENDRNMSRFLQDIWIRFDQGFNNWKPLSKTFTDQISYLSINSPDDISMTEVEYLGNRPFWDGLPLHENHNLFGKKDEL